MTISHERALRVPLPERYAVEHHLPDTATAAWEALA